MTYCAESGTGQHELCKKPSCTIRGWHCVFCWEPIEFCDHPTCPGRSASMPRHETESGPEVHDDCRVLPADRQADL